MSKIGRRPIALQDVKVEIKGNELHYTGKNASGVHIVPTDLNIVVADGALTLLAEKATRKVNEVWGLHRALLANKIYGAHTLFERQVKIVGLGYKATVQGSSIEFSLGYSHKITVTIPKEVTAEVDKTGQLITFKSYDKELVGKVAGDMRRLRPVEPYKGTGVFLTTDVVIRKAGKAKSAS